jgi:hypothetical protein
VPVCPGAVVDCPPPGAVVVDGLVAAAGGLGCRFSGAELGAGEPGAEPAAGLGDVGAGSAGAGVLGAMVAGVIAAAGGRRDTAGERFDDRVGRRRPECPPPVPAETIVARPPATRERLRRTLGAELAATGATGTRFARAVRRAAGITVSLGGAEPGRRTEPSGSVPRGMTPAPASAKPASHRTSSTPVSRPVVRNRRARRPEGSASMGAAAWGRDRPRRSVTRVADPAPARPSQTCCGLICCSLMGTPPAPSLTVRLL